MHEDTGSGSDLAIVGMACRFPGAGSTRKFWRVLSEGHETTTFFDDEQVTGAGVDPRLAADPNYVRAGQVLPDVDRFDAGYFAITGDEAEILDPQHRQFLECAVEALEDAGYDPAGHVGPIGVYAGAGMNTYLLQNLGDRYRAASSAGHYRFMLANDKDFLATRVSYKLDLRGPSVNVNTACSTSLVAVHMAGLGLLSGECEIALAGAVHIKVPQEAGYLHQEGMIFSPDGHCRAFDASAAGTVIGNGAGIVVLKRLSDALADGDTLHAVVKGSALNNDGSLKTGYTAPSVQRQAAVVAEAQDIAGCAPESVSYVEAHGTGTPLGDPIEVAALTEAFGNSGECALGSVKTNIGHLDTAAGMAGLIKTSLMLRNRTLVPSLHFTEANPDIDFDGGPFRVQTETAEWPQGDTPRRAGVSSFGIGGTNAHVVLEEPPEPAPAPAPRGAELLVLSARSEQALAKLTGDLARHLKQHPELALSDVAHTLAAGRRAHRHRRAVVCRDTRDAALALALVDERRVRTGQDGGARPAFLLADRLADSGAHAVALYRDLPAFREAVDECVVELGAPPGADVQSLLTAGDGLAAFVGQYGLCAVWRQWGVFPAAVVGSGAGELLAAHLAGSLDLPAALAAAEAHSSGEVAVGCRPAEPRLPIGSAATGQWLSAELATDPDTWAKPAAAAPEEAVRLLTGTELLDCPVEPAVAAGQSALEALLTTAGRLWAAGVALDWQGMFPPQRRRRVSLPTYPFQGERYWVEPSAAGQAERPEVAETPEVAEPSGLRHRVENATGAERARLLREFVHTEVERVLGSAAEEPVDDDRNLFDMGVDSLILIDISAKLGAEFQRAVPSSAFVENPTIRTFVDSIGELFGLETGQSQQQRSRRSSRRAAARAE